MKFRVLENERATFILQIVANFVFYENISDLYRVQKLNDDAVHFLFPENRQAHINESFQARSRT
ncbi:unnamed protein product [Trichogramma brassicae]|uniref:Uncharacterized protein n=1 Tax=Trichogramma brassicae TaxID=86971 RepID=A0A6H5I3W7_9HYME|nr:unnamed protein product [Trichogramma brassicae]